MLNNFRQNKSRHSISIIIPTFNDEDFLMETLSSVFNQTVLPNEIVIIDDGSREKYAEKFIKTFSDNESIKIQLRRILNSGPSVARNLGAKLSTSDFLIFLDSDDLLMKDAIEKFHSKIINFDFNKFWGVHGGISFVGSTKKFIPIKELKLDQSTLDKIGKNKILEGLSSFLFSKNSFNEIKGFRENLNHNEDFDIVLRLSQKKALKINENIVVKIRKRKGSLSNKNALDAYLGVKKFINIALKESLLSTEEILIRKKENCLIFAKALIKQGLINNSMKKFNEAFKYSKPLSLKEGAVYYISAIYVKILSFFA
ncbi:glycosyltransferase family 2 protein [Gammaproteobacteria bacterium]|nr:glycosyltransferase family 2 protein [Gammaproteobacteria bacterium]